MQINVISAPAQGVEGNDIVGRPDCNQSVLIRDTLIDKY